MLNKSQVVFQILKMVFQKKLYDLYHLNLILNDLKQIL